MGTFDRAEGGTAASPSAHWRWRRFSRLSGSLRPGLSGRAAMQIAVARSIYLAFYFLNLRWEATINTAPVHFLDHFPAFSRTAMWKSGDGCEKASKGDPVEMGLEPLKYIPFCGESSDRIGVAHDPINVPIFLSISNCCRGSHRRPIGNPRLRKPDFSPKGSKPPINDFVPTLCDSDSA